MSRRDKLINSYTSKWHIAVDKLAKENLQGKKLLAVGYSTDSYNLSKHFNLFAQRFEELNAKSQIRIRLKFKNLREIVFIN